MIYQVHFTISLELIALVAGTVLFLYASKLEKGRLLGKLMGGFTMLMAIILLLSTGYFLYLAPKPPSNMTSGKNNKPKLKMAVPKAGPTKGGYLNSNQDQLKTQGRFPIQFKPQSKGGSITLPPMTVKQKKPNSN